MTTLDEKITQLQEIIDNAKHIVFFTGAGVSTDSGIPDFRSQDGLYHLKYKYPPEEIVSHHCFQQKPEPIMKVHLQLWCVHWWRKRPTYYSRTFYHQ